MSRPKIKIITIHIILLILFISILPYFILSFADVKEKNEAAQKKIYAGCPTQCDDGSKISLLYTALSFSNLKRQPDMDDDTWRHLMKCYLYSKGSIGCDVPVPNDYEYELKMMSDKPFDVSLVPNEKMHVGGHGMVIMGYDDEMGAWMVRNSWSSRWPNNGYIYWKYGMGNIENILFTCQISP